MVSNRAIAVVRSAATGMGGSPQNATVIPVRGNKLWLNEKTLLSTRGQPIVRRLRIADTLSAYQSSIASELKGCLREKCDKDGHGFLANALIAGSD